MILSGRNNIEEDHTGVEFERLMSSPEPQKDRMTSICR